MSMAAHIIPIYLQKAPPQQSKYKGFERTQIPVISLNN